MVSIPHYISKVDPTFDSPELGGIDDEVFLVDCIVASAKL
jgi:hypothetical protein